MPTRNCGVQCNQAKTAEVPHAGNRLFAGLFIEQFCTQDAAFVVVSGDPDQGCIKLSSQRLQRPCAGG